MPRKDAVPLKRFLRSLKVDRVDFCTAGSNGESDIVLFKAIPSKTSPRKGAPMPAPDKKPEPTADEIAALQKAIDEGVAKALEAHDVKVGEFLKAEADKPAPEPDEVDPVQKAINDAVAVEKAERVKLEAEVQKMKDAEAERVFKARARTLPMVGSEDDVAKVLKGIAKGDSSVYELAEALLDTANERITKGDYVREVGGPGSSVGTGGAAVIQSAADQFMKDDPTLTLDAALSKAAKANPDAFAAMRKSFRGTTD